jgi:3alpha(or 20beta)-hydroxysteroid dehydrogenase
VPYLVAPGGCTAGQNETVGLRHYPQEVSRMARFDKTVALVTGGARGMGFSHAQGLTAEGARVVIADVLVDEGKMAADTLGEMARFVHLDVTNEHEWEETVAFTEREFGPLTLLVNNAGIVEYGTVEQTTPELFRRVIEINLVGTFLGMHYSVPSLKKAGGGVIINISSTAGMMGYAQIGAYVASKWGVRGLTKAAAMELGHDGIRVVSVHPGPIRTPMTAGMGEEIAVSQPIARFGEPEEVTKMVLFLAAEATFSTGSEFIVDGGALLGPVMNLEQAEG